MLGLWCGYQLKCNEESGHAWRECPVWMSQPEQDKESTGTLAWGVRALIRQGECPFGLVALCGIGV